MKNTDALILRWWNAWRQVVDDKAVASLFGLKSRYVRRCCCSGMAEHEVFSGMVTAKADRLRGGRIRWRVHPFGMVHWHVSRLALGARFAPRAVLALEAAWPDTWRALQLADPATYRGPVPPFSWRRLALKWELLAVGLAILWQRSGMPWGGPFIPCEDMPADFMLKMLGRHSGKDQKNVRER